MHAKTLEDYCRLIDKHDNGNGARSTDLARELALSKNTVSLTLQKLSKEGFVKMEKYGKAKLSPSGLLIAKKMNFKHRVIETFLFSKLGMGKKSVHNEAQVMEHFISDEVAKRLYQFMGKPKTDPHGQRIR